MQYPNLNIIRRYFIIFYIILIQLLIMTIYLIVKIICGFELSTLQISIYYNRQQLRGVERSNKCSYEW